MLRVKNCLFLLIIALSAVSPFSVALSQEAIDIDALRQELETLRKQNGSSQQGFESSVDVIKPPEKVSQEVKTAIVANKNSRTAEADNLQQTKTETQAPEWVKELQQKESADNRNNLQSQLIADLKSRLKGLKSKLAEKDRQLAAYKKNSKKFEMQAREAQEKLADLEAKLNEARNRLIFAETEVERLSAIVEQRNNKALARFAPHRSPGAAAGGSPVPTDLSSEEVFSDMPIATVVVNKANLRSGAGINNSPLMTVRKGTRLAVEKRFGDWYRVITPTGSRAWISSSVVSFGAHRKASPNKTIRIKGYNANLESESFRRISASVSR
ncbi:MAG: hypothetical protein D6719_02590 [Candidatus Dadabacteria bacterium]|nr:MAG: hypothetical protein D6719_02590 [Candidatus Dadabacteria bacterium]